MAILDASLYASVGVDFHLPHIFQLSFGTDVGADASFAAGSVYAGSLQAFFNVDPTADAARGWTSAFSADFNVLGGSPAYPGYVWAPNDVIGPVVFEFELGLSEVGSFVFPYDFDFGSGAEGALVDGFEISLGDPALHATSFSQGALALTPGLSLASGIDGLNRLLGLLVPAAPPSFPNATLTIANAVGSSPLLASGVTDHTSGVSGLSAGQSVTRITASSATSNLFATVGPGDSGLITVLVNAAPTGSHTLTGTGDNGSYGALVISAQAAYPTETPGFHTSISLQVIGASVSEGINTLQVTDTAAAPTGVIGFVRDSLSAVPTVSSGSLAEHTAGTLAYSSSVPHYGTGASLSAGLSYSNLAGDTYYGGTDPVTISGAVLAAQSFGYPALGISTPIVGQTTAPVAVTTLTVPVNGSGHTSGVIQAVAKNVNGPSTTTNLSSTVVLLKSGSAGGKIDENAVAVSGLGSGSSAVRVANGSGDTPATAASSWTSSSAIQTYDATVVAGVLANDDTDYASGHLPVGPDLSGHDTNQYATFAFERSALSQFKINVTGTYAGCWIKLPGVSDQIGISPNAPNGWWTAEQPYVGAGVPGGGSDGVSGCALGAVMNGASGSFTVTFGTQSSSNATTNQILVRFKLAPGQSITALSFSN